jgi:peptidyl-prolyl cis-trans isomerase A (cyclophilin A)
MSYVEGGHLADLSFYRTVNPQNDNHPLKIDVLQGGINANFDESFVPAFAPIAHEPTTQTGLTHSRGAVSYARGELGSAQIDFFVSIANNAHLDAGGLRHPDQQGFSVFGRVVKGMDIIDKIASLPADKEHPDAYVKNQILNEQVVITSITIKHQ